jgi:hypothetical protein
MQACNTISQSLPVLPKRLRMPDVDLPAVLSA